MTHNTTTRVEFHRSRIDWEDDGNVTDYGWYATLFVRGKHRVRWHSTRNTTPMWPGFSQGADENCNRAVTLVLWPLGHLDVWWEPKWRTEEDGECDDCRRELAEFRDPAPACSALWSRNRGVSCCVDTPHTVHRGSSEPGAPSWGDGECAPGTLTDGRGGR